MGNHNPQIQLLFLVKKLLDIIPFRHETSHDNKLLILCHSELDYVGKSIHLGAAHGIDLPIIIGKVPTRDLRQTQEPCENVCCGHFQLIQFDIAFVLDAGIQFYGILLQIHGTDFLDDCWKIEALCLRNSERHRIMELPQKIIGHPFTKDQRVIAVTTHVKILVMEGIERCSEYLRIKETVLRKHVQFSVCNDRSRKEKACISLYHRCGAFPCSGRCDSPSAYALRLRSPSRRCMPAVPFRAATPIRNLRPRPARPRQAALSTAPFSLTMYL